MDLHSIKNLETAGLTVSNLLLDTYMKNLEIAGLTVRTLFRQIFGSRVQHTKTKWTKTDLRFCENEGLKIFKINEKMCQLDRKSRRKLIQNA